MVLVLFILGTIVPLASVRAWGRAFPRWMLASALWAGCAVLLRGGAGMVDEGLRVTCLSPTGLRGLTREQVIGSADPSATILWTGRATDAFFVLGGVLFGLAVHVYHRAVHTTTTD